MAASWLVMPSSVKAGSNTIVVPDDYPTIHAAIGNATDGDTIFVRPGTYEETPLKANKTLSLIGEGADSTKISFDPPYTEFWWNILQKSIVYENPIEVYADHFKLSGFTIVTTGGSIGIKGNGTKITGNQILTDIYVSGSHLNITENTLLGDVEVGGSYSNIVENTFSGAITATGSYLNISANKKSSSSIIRIDSGITVSGSFCIISENAITAKGLHPSISVNGNRNIVAKNNVTRSLVGISVGGSSNMIYGNRIINCFSQLTPLPLGGIAIGVSGNNTVFANRIVNNAWGANVNPNPKTNLTSTFYHNNFVGNTQQVILSNDMFSYGNDSFDNGVEGNYWSDYTGIDVDGDGIGDTPYIIDDNRLDRYPLMAPFDIDSVALELPEWATPPTIRLNSPENTTYASENVTLEFTVNKQTTWLAYSLDGQETVTVTGNITLIGLSNGLHNVTVHAKDALENMGKSETTYFSVKVPEPFPTTLVATTAIASGAVVGIALLVYFKKRRR
jgi:hypothetical protein